MFCNERRGVREAVVEPGRDNSRPHCPVAAEDTGLASHFEAQRMSRVGWTGQSASAFQSRNATAPAAKYSAGSHGATPARPSEPGVYSEAPMATMAISASGP